MARLVRRRSEILVVVEQIILQIVFLLNLLVARQNLLASRRRKRNNRLIRYRMSDKIPDRVTYLDSLVGKSDTDCYAKLRMDRGTFSRFCYLLQHAGGLSDSKYVSVREKVSLFLTVLSHHAKLRCVRFDFKRSTHSLSVHFHSVLNTVLKLHSILLAKPEPIDESCTHPRWKWFKGCIGALDGIYVEVTVPESDKPRYRTRKGTVSVNVLAACDMNLRFMYMLTGWEGSAADSRILRDAVSRPNGLKVPQGHYFLCDNGYMNGEGFLTPYKSVRYHLDDWGTDPSLPQNYQEFYNMNHSRARNVIERSFGIIKKRWAILRSPTFYPIKVQNRLIMACALIHNFIRRFMPNHPMEEELDDIILEHDDADADPANFIDTVESSQAWTTYRDDLAQRMYNEWIGA